TEAMSDNRHVELDRLAKKGRNWRDPRQRIVHAHRSAHESDARERTGIGGNRGTVVDLHEFPTKPARIEPFGEVRRTLGGRKTEDGNRSHRHGCPRHPGSQRGASAITMIHITSAATIVSAMNSVRFAAMALSMLVVAVD